MDRAGRKGGGVAIFVKNSITHSLTSFNTKIIETIAITITTTNIPITIVSVYFAGTRINASKLQDFKNDIRLLTNNNNSFFICGDFNSRHRQWGCSRANAAGNALQDLESQNLFTVHHPSTPTYYPTSPGYQASVIDLILTNNRHNISNINSVCELSSDHVPVNFEITSNILLKTENPTYLSYQKANWTRFYFYLQNNIELTGTIQESLSTPERIDKEIEHVNKLLTDAQNIAVPRVQIKNNRQLIIPDELKLLMRLRNIRRRQWQRNRHPVLRDIYNSLNKLVAERIMELRNKNWNNYLEKLKPSSKPFYNTVKVIKKQNQNLPPLKHNGDIIVTNADKANVIGSKFMEAHCLTSNLSNQQITDEVNGKFMEIKHSNFNFESTNLVHPGEIKNIIKQLASSKAPGHDNINNQLIKKSPKKLHILLAYIFNACFRIAYYPKIWKLAVIIPLPKPNKDSSNPANYRPISLLSSLSKIFERVIHTRLLNHLEENNIIPDIQHGFRRGFSTNHQVRRLTNTIKENLNRKMSTGVVLMDIEKAFDSVWHAGMIYKLWKINTPLYLTKMIQSYITNRSFKVRIKNSSSQEFNIAAGVPQGAVLSPTLYITYTADIPIPNQCELFLFADDSAIISTSHYPNDIIVNLEEGIIKLNEYFHKWKIKTNLNKTQAAFFTRKRSARNLPQRRITCSNNTVEWENEIKYLGIILDKTITFSKHINHTLNKTNKFIKILYPFINKKSKLSVNNKLIIYKCIFRSIITYGAPVWGRCAKTHIKKLQIMQNKILKMIYNLPIRYSSNRLHNIDDIEFINTFIQKLITNYNTNTASGNSAINNLVNL